LRITKPNELLDKKDLILINIFVLALLLLSRIYIFNMVEQTEQINTTKRFIKIKSSHQKRKKKKKKKKKTPAHKLQL
jgi:glutaredoxin-related protein